MFSCCSTRIKTETKLQLNFETGVNCGIVLKKRDKLDKKHLHLKSTFMLQSYILKSLLKILFIAKLLLKIYDQYR